MNFPHFRTSRLLLTGGLAALLGASLPAQEPTVSGSGSVTAPARASIVRDIQIAFDGPATVDPARVRANMFTKVGDPLTPETLQRDIASLYDSGIVENVEMLAEPFGGGQRLIVKVKGTGALGSVSFVGNEKIEDGMLAKVADLDLGQSLDEQKLQEARTGIVDHYRRKGYPEVGVTYSTRTDARGFTSVVFNVAEGGQSLLNQTRFEGNTVFTEKELRKEVVTKKKGLLNFWTDAGKIDRNKIAEDIQAIESLYRNSGYLDAKVVKVDQPRASDRKVDVVYHISEGAMYTVQTVSVNGMSIGSPDEVTPFFLQTAGAPYSAAAIDADATTIREYYGSRGYADARVNARLRSAGNNVLAVNYDVSEGSKSYVNRILIAGNTKTQDKVIRRELAIAPGDEFNTVKVNASRSRIANLGYFEPRSIDFQPSASGRPGYKDLTINLQEKSTGSVNFGAGFSSIDSVVGFFDITQSNFDLFGPPDFTGGGQKFRLGVKYGNERRDFQLTIVEPWFLDQRLSLGGDLFYRDLAFYSDDYEQRDIGGDIFLRKPIGEHAYIRGEYKLQQIKIHKISDNASEAIRQEEGEYVSSQLSVEVVHDTRDDLFLTRSGHKFEVGLSQAIGGDVDVFGFDAGAIQYWNGPGDVIFSLEGRVASVQSNNDDRVPIFERNFLGGANNLRGFDYRDVGPKDETGEPLGGGTSAYFSAEATVPIVDKVRAAVFYDAGFVNAGDFDFSSSNYNSNFGFGLRLYLPVGPIRLDFGIPIESDEFNDSGGQFNFNIGYRF